MAQEPGMRDTDMSAEQPAGTIAVANLSERARRYAWLYDDEDMWAPLPDADAERSR
jgi:hypothetical protein